MQGYVKKIRNSHKSWMSELQHPRYRRPERTARAFATSPHIPLGVEKLRPRKKSFVCDGQNLFWPKNVLFWADKITTPEKTRRSLQNNIFFHGKDFVLAKQNLFWPEKVFFATDKIFFREKCFVFAGKNLFCPKKVLFSSDETFSGQTRFYSEESSREWPN